MKDVEHPSASRSWCNDKSNTSRVSMGADTNACAFSCRSALEHAPITAVEAHDPQRVQHLDGAAGRLLNK